MWQCVRGNAKIDSTVCMIKLNFQFRLPPGVPPAADRSLEIVADYCQWGVALSRQFGLDFIEPAIPPALYTSCLLTPSKYLYGSLKQKAHSLCTVACSVACSVGCSVAFSSRWDLSCLHECDNMFNAADAICFYFMAPHTVWYLSATHIPVHL